MTRQNLVTHKPAKAPALPGAFVVGPFALHQRALSPLCVTRFCFVTAFALSLLSLCHCFCFVTAFALSLLSLCHCFFCVIAFFCIIVLPRHSQALFLFIFALVRLGQCGLYACLLYLFHELLGCQLGVQVGHCQ